MTTFPQNPDHPCFHDDEAARIMFEQIFWPYGPTCPTCGKIDTVSVGGKSMGPGWYWCSECRENFTVRVGSVLERSHIPLHKWALGFRLYASSKKGFSALQLKRHLNLGSYRSAWFMAHRIREAMDGSADQDEGGPLGGQGKVVEADETRFGTRKRAQWSFVNGVGWVKMANREQMLIMTLVERGGRARSVKVEDLTSDSLHAVLVTNASRKSDLHTDELHAYREPGREFHRHETVNHQAEEYSRRTRDGRKVTTNTVEGYFSIFKRGMVGVYQHCSEKHLARYLSEFDFRYSNRIALGVHDAERTERAIKGAVGRRLTYRRTGSGANV